jgi:cell division septation protein DedD
MVFSVRVAGAVVVVAIVVVAVVEEGRANGSTNHCGWRFAKLGTKQLRPKSRRRPTVIACGEKDAAVAVNRAVEF